MWSDGVFNPMKQQMLGITHDNLPAIGFLRLTHDIKLSYPGDWPLHAKAIEAFVEDYLSYSIDTLA